MVYYLGIDGGGTKTEALLSDAVGNILRIIKAAGSNPNFVGKDSALKTIIELLSSILREIDLNEISQAVLCIPGIRDYKEELFEMIDFDRKRIHVEGDDLNTFYGALCKEYGAVVLTGTGSFVLGIDKTGKKKVVGGWGPLIGDLGSGYWMGVSALKAVTKYFDGLGRKTVLADKIKKFYGIEDISLLRRVVNHSDISLLTPLILEAVSEKDKISLSIVKKAAKDLAKMAKRVILELKLDEEEYDLAIAGGISNFGKILWEPFTREIRSRYRKINITKPQFTPSVGSILIALKEDNIPWSYKILKNLKTSYERMMKDAYGNVF